MSGVASAVNATIEAMGWTWSEPLKFHRPGKPSLGIIDGPTTWWLHEIRTGGEAGGGGEGGGEDGFEVKSNNPNLKGGESQQITKTHKK